MSVVFDYIASSSLTAAANGTNYIPLSCMAYGAHAAEGNSQVPYRTVLNFSKFRVNISSNTVSASSTLRFRKNGADGNQSVSIPASTSGEFIDPSNSDSVAAGDLINLRLTTGATGTSLIVNGYGITSDTPDIRYGFRMTAVTATASNTTFWALSGATSTSQIIESRAKLTIRGNGLLKNGWVNVLTNTRGTPTTFQSRVNGNFGNISISIIAGVTGVFEDTADTDSLNAGDGINYALTTGTGSGNIQIYMGVSFAPGSNNIYPLVFGMPSGFLATTGSINFIEASGVNTSATESLIQMDLKSSYRARNMFCSLSTNLSTAGNTTINLRKNGASVNLNLSIPHGTTGYFEDLTNSDLLISGDLINYQVTAATGGTSTFNIIGVHLDYSLFPDMWGGFEPDILRRPLQIPRSELFYAPDEPARAAAYGWQDCYPVFPPRRVRSEQAFIFAPPPALNFWNPELPDLIFARLRNDYLIGPVILAPVAEAGIPDIIVTGFYADGWQPTGILKDLISVEGVIDA